MAGCAGNSKELLDADVDAAVREVNGRVASVKKVVSDSDLQLEISLLEGTHLVISVSIQGYTITSGLGDYESRPAYESLHTLLSEHSIKYRDEFGSSLANALANLQEFRDIESGSEDS